MVRINYISRWFLVVIMFGKRVDPEYVDRLVDKTTRLENLYMNLAPRVCSPEHMCSDMSAKIKWRDEQQSDRPRQKRLILEEAEEEQHGHHLATAALATASGADNAGPTATLPNPATPATGLPTLAPSEGARLSYRMLKPYASWTPSSVRIVLEIASVQHGPSKHK